MTLLDRARGAAGPLADAAAVLAPVACAACGRPGRSCCRACLGELRLSIDPRLEPLPGAGPPVPLATAVEYGGPAAALLAALKERGRLDARRPLAGLLAAAVRLALEEAAADEARPGRMPGRIVIVPAPSSPAAVRRRGMRHLDELLALACGARPSPSLLVHAREVRDQAGLGAEARRANLRGALRGSPELRGRRALLVDDVATSGATLAEAARAVRAAGGIPVAAAAIARASLRRRTVGGPGDGELNSGNRDGGPR